MQPIELDSRVATRRVHSRLPWSHLFLSLYGAGWAVSFDVGVRIYGAEIFSIAAFVLIRWSPVLRTYPMLRRILAAYGLWVIAIFLSDLVNGTALFDSARNMATPIIGGASLVSAVAALSRKPSALLSFLVATAIGKAIFGDPAYSDSFADLAVSQASILEEDNFFKVRVEPFLTPTVLVLAYWVGRQKLQRAAMVFLLASVSYFLLDTRSSALAFLLSAIAVGTVSLGVRPRRAHILAAVAVGTLLAYSAYAAYVTYTLNYNRDGHNARQLQVTENPYNPLELLLVGRSDLIVTPTAIAERPLFGWGSWAEDKDGRFADMRLRRLGSLDYLDVRGTLYYMPAHSLIGAAWVWSGLLGFISVAWLLRTVWKAGLRLPSCRSHLLPIVMFMLFMLTWHYFFSPPMLVRLYYPIAVAALLVVTRELKRRRTNDARSFVQEALVVGGRR